ncbi:MAG: TonB-dependent receptor plug domain-containing protein [Opitutaceae bacterium]
MSITHPIPLRPSRRWVLRAGLAALQSVVIATAVHAADTPTNAPATQLPKAPTTAAATDRITAQTAPDQEEEVVLSPFVVSADDEKDRYQATSTLAGTRVKTDLKDVSSSLSVVTAQFLKDTGATNNETLLVYTTNTEVGGIYGNYGGVGNTFLNGSGEPSMTQPSTNTRVRGLDSADNTRDYFQTSIPWDSFNVGRVDLQRGPNSILFGIGSPAGIINSSVNLANFKDSFKVENRIGSYGSNRNSLDFNKVILNQELALRVAALDDRTKYQQKPAYNHDRRLFGTVRWDPKLFNMASAHTTLRANFEHGEVTANRPHVLPPMDNITPFFTKLNKTTWDNYYAWVAGLVQSADGKTPTLPGESKQFWVGGRGFSETGVNLTYGSNTASLLNVISSYYPASNAPAAYYGISPTGARDGVIDGYRFSPAIGITGFNAYSIINNIYSPKDPGTLGAASGFYKDKVLTDPTIFDFYNNMLEGSNSKQWQGWDSFNLSLEQTFLNNRVAFQAVYDHQNYNDGQQGLYNNAITVDIMTNSVEKPWPYSTSVRSYNGSGTAGTNPNAGRAYIAGNPSTGSSVSTRESIRFTGTGELRATDFLSKSWLTDLLGRHVFTGLFSRDTYDLEKRSWLPYAMDAAWPDALGSGPAQNGINGLGSKNRTIGVMTHTGSPLFTATSASGLYLQPVTAVYNPSGSINVRYHDSHWKPSTNPTDPTYVNPAAAWTNAVAIPGTMIGANSTQSENPANYVGWKTGTFNVLNAAAGDIDQLYTDGSKIQRITESKALTWQGFLWDDCIVGTYGWRRDTQKQRSGIAPLNDQSVANMSYDLSPLNPATGQSTGDSRSWGVVVHQPKFLRNKLPWGTNFSLVYNEGRNSRVEARYGFDTKPLPNSKGETKDFGFVVRTLDDRLSLKVTWYKTTVSDANLSSNPAVSIFGINEYFLNNLELYGVANSMINLCAIAGQIPSTQPLWFWDYAASAGRFTQNINNPANPAWQADPATVLQKAASLSFLAQLNSKEWWDAFSIPINLEKAAAGDWANAIPNWNTGKRNWDLTQSGTKGRVNGLYPTGTIDDESKGIEFELNGQILKNWNVSINASKQHAAQISLGDAFVNYVEKMHNKYATPAGDIRLWAAGDRTIRQYYEQNIYAPYLFMKDTSGRLVPEMSPWRFNAVTNYSFNQGMLKGFNVGLGYRWQQGVILGYGVKSDYSNLDVDKPIWGKSTFAVDMWAGYERKLTNKINWRVQLNVRNVGSDTHLEALSVEPDGSVASARIVQGQTWYLTNTLSF